MLLSDRAKLLATLYTTPMTDKPTRQSAWYLMIPALSILILVGVIPLVTVVNHSLHDIFTLPDKYWVGSEWYQGIVSSSRFWQSLGRSLLFSLIVLGIQIPLGILIALALPRRGALVPICLIITALPLLLPWNVIPGIWLSLINPDTGIVGKLIDNLGFTLDWKFNPVHTWVVIVLLDVWHWTSLVVILCYSSLTTIQLPYYQAAAIDCASRLQVFRYVQLPRLRSVLLMVLLLRFMDSFMIYTEAFRINAGGPQFATHFLAIDLAEEINAYNYGPAAARSVVYFLMVLGVAWAFKTALFASERRIR